MSARSYGVFPKACASCGHVITSPGDELRHIDFHLARTFRPDVYSKLDAAWRAAGGDPR